MICIVTDSSAQLGLEISGSKQYQTIVLPHHITLDGKTYLEGVDLDSDALALRMKNAKSVSISGPTEDEFYAVYKKLADEKADVISLHVSSALSNTIQHATRARAAFLGRCNIHVVDSRCVSLGLRELVKATQQFILKNKTLDETVQHLRGLIPHVYGMFVSSDMLTLERSKRLRPAQALLGKMLDIIPCLSLEEGDIVAVEKVRNTEKAVERLAEFAGEFDEFERLAILQQVPDMHEQIQQLMEGIAAYLPSESISDVPVESCGLIVGNIIGSKGYGVMIYEGEKGLR